MSAHSARDRDLLTRFALWISPTWEDDNEDDRESASAAVEAFLDELLRRERA